MSVQSHLQKHRWIIGCILLIFITLVIDEVIFSDQKRRVDPQSAITNNLHQQLTVLDEQLQEVSTRTITSVNRLFSRLDKSEVLPYFLFENGEIIYWSTNRFVPKYGTLSGTYLYKFLDIKSGQYIVKRKVVNSNNHVIEIFALLPLVSNAKISEDFTENGMNAKVFGRSNYVLTAAGGASGAKTISAPEGIPLFTYDGSPLMKIDYPVYDALIFLLYALCIIAFLMAGFTYAHRLAHDGQMGWACVLLTLFFLFFRALALYYVFPLSIIEWPMFRPFAYADGFWQPSVGDLFVNVLSLWGIVLFVFNHFARSKKRLSTLALISIFVGFIGLTWHFHYQLESMIVNGQWSFDITAELGFSLAKVLGYLSVFISAMMPVMLMHLLLLQAEVSQYRQSLVKALGLAALIGILAFVFAGSTLFGLTSLILAYAFLILFFGLASQLSKLNYSSFLHLFLSCFIWSAMALLILNENVITEQRLNKTALAIDLRSENDITGEFLLDQTRQRIEADILIQTNISNPFSPKDLIDQKIRRVYLGDYFDKYEIEILLFNGNGKPINASALDLEVLQEVYATPENATEFEDLYFLNDDFPQSLKQYYLFCQIKRYDTVIGHVLIKLDRKRQLNNSILPKLLLDEEPGTNLRNDLSYAFFKAGELEEQNGTFNYRRDFNLGYYVDQLDLNNEVVANGFTHTWFDLNEEEVLVISSPVYPAAYKLTNFSIFFLFMIALIMAIFGLVSLLINSRKQQTTISTKVQILLNFAFFLPLITVSIVVLQLVNDTVEENLESKYLTTTRSAAENMVNPLYFFLESRDMNSEGIENRIAEISQYAGADINLFNTAGQLIATNQRLIFENDLLAPFANPDAVASVIESSNVGELQLEQVGDITYKATYYAIIGGEEKELLGVLSMPFFDSQEELIEEQRQILSNILNAFTLIFVIFVVLSFLASRIITYPFTYLTKKIRATTLTKENEPLIWQADDEIGLLVREYNQMLLNLEKSKKALAQSEKESAWREMAQQVAHEIKNPLTPMKLKLQHLKRVLTTAEVEDADFEKPINNLLQQVETLSDIATSFSSFAKMPIPHNERVELNKVLKRALGLFSEEEITIQKEILKESVWIMADEQLLGRIFNNLILNAMQASEEQTHAVIDVRMELKHKKVLISVRDEGKGIPEAIRDKVFVPKFSTKKEGSGIGLAIAKRGVEHAGGSIWFESVEGEGTTFFIEFPIID